MKKTILFGIMLLLMVSYSFAFTTNIKDTISDFFGTNSSFAIIRDLALADCFVMAHANGTLYCSSNSSTDYTTQLDSLLNLSFTDITDNIGNWSANKSSYTSKVDLDNGSILRYYNTTIVFDDELVDSNNSVLGYCNAVVSDANSSIKGYVDFNNASVVDYIDNLFNSAYNTQNFTTNYEAVSSRYNGDNFTLDFNAEKIGNTTDEIKGTINQSGEFYGIICKNVSDDIYLRNIGDTAEGNYTFNTSLLHIDGTNNRIGVGTTNPERELHIYDVGATRGLQIGQGGGLYKSFLTSNGLVFNREGKSYVDQINDSGSLVFRVSTAFTEIATMTTSGTQFNKNISVSGNMNVDENITTPHFNVYWNGSCMIQKAKGLTTQLALC